MLQRPGHGHGAAVGLAVDIGDGQLVPGQHQAARQIGNREAGRCVAPFARLQIDSAIELRIPQCARGAGLQKAPAPRRGAGKKRAQHAKVDRAVRRDVERGRSSNCTPPLSDKRLPAPPQSHSTIRARPLATSTRVGCCCWKATPATARSTRSRTSCPWTDESNGRSASSVSVPDTRPDSCDSVSAGTNGASTAGVIESIRARNRPGVCGDARRACEPDRRVGRDERDRNLSGGRDGGVLPRRIETGQRQDAGVIRRTHDQRGSPVVGRPSPRGPRPGSPPR